MAPSGKVHYETIPVFGDSCWLAVLTLRPTKPVCVALLNKYAHTGVGAVLGFVWNNNLVVID